MIRASVYGRPGRDSVERTSQDGDSVVMAVMAVKPARLAEIEPEIAITTDQIDRNPLLHQHPL